MAGNGANRSPYWANCAVPDPARRAVFTGFVPRGFHWDPRSLRRLACYSSRRSLKTLDCFHSIMCIEIQPVVPRTVGWAFFQVISGDKAETISFKEDILLISILK
jgi:hypothetical protein